MKNILGLVLLILLGVGGYYAWQQRQSPTVVPTTEQTMAESPTPAPAMTYTLAQVAEHPDKESCWLTIEGKVYDVTPFVAGGFHPGKEAILQGCGKDATELFNTRPMARSPSPHSARAREMLPNYYIGELVQE